MAPDPLLGLRFRHLALLVGLLVLLVALFSMLTPRRALSVAAVARLATNFVVSRGGLSIIGWHRPCGCLGSLTDLLHRWRDAADNVMKVALAYLPLWGYGILFHQCRQVRGAGAAPAISGSPA
jgi:hypothetical protein